MYIYGLRERNGGSYGYVGASKHPRRRYGQHLSLPGDTQKDVWLSSLSDVPELVILEQVELGINWRDREEFWIRKLLQEGHPLTNALRLNGERAASEKRCKHCEREATRRGMCDAHYMRWYRKQKKLQPTYEQGLEEGRGQAVQAMHNIFEPRGGSCWIEDDWVYVELQGQAFKGRMG